MAIILCLDTSTDVAFVGIAKDGQLLAAEQSDQQRNHAALINVMIAAVLASVSLKLKDIDAVAVCNGPGSYTGLRVGLSTAKGICYAGEKKLIVLNKLTLLGMQSLKDAAPEAYAFVCLCAREGEYYAALFSKQKEVLSPAHLSTALVQEVLDDVRSYSLLISTDSELQDLNIQTSFPIIDGFVNPYSYCQLAEDYLKHGTIANIAEVVPFYLKGAYTTVAKSTL